MKLKCADHNRRVLSVPNNPSFLHRTGDKSRCTSKTASLTDNTSHITRKFRIAQGELVQVECDKKSRPHTKRKE